MKTEIEKNYAKKWVRRLFVPMLIMSFEVSRLHGDDTLEKSLMQQEIEHVVVLVLENRSFDNVLGWLYNEDSPLHILPSGSTLPFQGLSSKMLTAYANPLKDSKGKILYSSPPIQGTPSVKKSKLMNSPGTDPHETFDHVTDQIFGCEGGTEASMLGFVQNFATHWNEADWIKNRSEICAVMESYTAQQLPVLQGLARHYAVSDLWFSSVPTQTNPNRAFLACGTSEGQTVNGCLGKSTFCSDTIWNRLAAESPDTSWAIFWQADMTPEIFPGPLTGPQTFQAMNRIPDVDQHFQRFDVFHELARKGELPHFSFIEPQWTISDSVRLEQLQKNCPNFKFLAGIQGNDLHPPGDVRTAENLLANIYTSLIANTEAWNKTLFVVLFDEHGGLFDHISPPASIAPDSCDQCGFAFDRYGVRTPALFISPRIKEKTVVRSDSSYPFDHTSLIATLLKWKQIDQAQWNMGARVSAAPTFEAVITELVPRIDPMITLAGFAPSQGQTVNMGDSISLKDPKGNYLTVSCLEHYATVGSEKERAALQFCPGMGKITHGSFVLLKLNDPSLCDEYILDSASLIGDCYYTKNTHKPCQWWTIKSVDHPYLGYEIKNGDRVYLECHVYLDLLTYVPARLATCHSWFMGKAVTTRAITDDHADAAYWTVEIKP
ncbi:MAG TPA: hypothetical protein DCE71_04875 [Parachlamydiales bacterium]|nr:hypothetical protein [Parachlamydiales bacterium]